MADDVAGDVTTTGSLVVGGSVTGTIESGVHDRDWFAIDLAAGGNYDIRIAGSAAAGTPLHDPYLRGIHDAAGNLLPLSTDDDSGPGLDALLRFRAPDSGRYYIAVGSYSEPIPTGTYFSGTDYLLSVTEVPVLRGGPGDDWLVWQPGDMIVDGGAGRDTLSLVAATAAVSQYFYSSAGGVVRGFASIGTAGMDLADIENVTGSRFGDRLGGTAAANTLRGMAGDDYLRGEGGADLIVGGAGRDTANLGDYWDLTAPGAVASLLRGRVWAGDSAGTRLQGIENLSGGGGNDVLTGDHQRNLIYGEYGDDTLSGLGGNDHLDGYHGRDTVIFRYAASEYTVTRNGFQTIVDHTGGNGSDGRDTLGHIETLRFADGDVIV